MTSPRRPADTATTHAARAHARSMSGTEVDTMPTVPPWSVADPPVGVSAADVVWDETVAGGGYTSIALRRGTRLRLVDIAGDACAGVLVHRLDRTAERLNVADTVKVQWQAYPGAGSLLLSDMGRVLVSLRDVRAGTVDAFGGTSNRASNVDRYGDGAPDGPTPNGRDLFAVALAKRGMSRRDVAPCVNFFVNVRVAADGGLEFAPGGEAGASATLVAEMDVAVSIVNVPHPLDDRRDYTATPLRVTAWLGTPTPLDDPIRTGSPEAERAFLNTEIEIGLTSPLGAAR